MGLAAQLAAPPESAAMTERTGDQRVVAPEDVARLAPDLLAVARYLVRSDSEARDIAQQTIEIGLRRLGQLRYPARLRSWLLAIEYRQVADWRRRMIRLFAIDNSVRELASPGTSLDRDFAVREAVRNLPPRIRAAVVLHHMSGLTVPDTARALGVSENTVKTQLRVGLSRLREDLQ